MTDRASNNVKVLSIGSVVGGRTQLNRAWIAEVDWLTREIAHARSEIDTDGIRLNIEFQIPGNILKPDFVGIRTGAFRRRDKLLKVQVALPEAPPAAPRAELLSLCRDAVAEAERWAIARRQHIDAECFRQIVARVPI